MPALALLLNAFVWGVSWFPFRQIAGHGLHPLWTTCLIYLAIAVLMGVLRRHAWKASRPFRCCWCWAWRPASPTWASTGP